MYQEYLAGSSYLIWPLIGLIIFVTMFLGVLAYVFLGLRDKDKVDKMAALPFEPEFPIDSGTMKKLANGRARS
jgi:hypothetical protein